MLELYHWEPNTFFLKPLIALKEKGLDFISHYVDPLESPVPPLVLNREAELNPELTGPLLVHDRRMISHSFFMLDYIDEAFPDVSLSPADAAGRYRMRAWGQLISGALAPAVNALGCRKYFVPRLAHRDRQEVDAMIAAIHPQEQRDAWSKAIASSWSPDEIERFGRSIRFAVARIEDALGKSPWLAGESYSLADIDAFAIARVLVDLAPEVLSSAAAPRLADWLGRIEERPAIKAALATSRTGKPQEAFAPGQEPSRWG